jgi:glycine/D-amino acid oxidase-like deaminating enzyme
VRSASGGDTRLSRVAHGEEHWSAEMARAARSRWLELEQETGMRIWEPVGLAWFARRADGFEARSRASLDQLGVPYEWLAPEEARGLFPSLSVDDLAAVLYEPEAGVLHRRRATQLLVELGEQAGVAVEPRHKAEYASDASDSAARQTSTR